MRKKITEMIKGKVKGGRREKGGQAWCDTNKLREEVKNDQVGTVKLEGV